MTRNLVLSSGSCIFGMIGMGGKVKNQCQFEVLLECSTSVSVFGCWLINHVTYVYGVRGQDIFYFFKFDPDRKKYAT